MGVIGTPTPRLKHGFERFVTIPPSGATVATVAGAELDSTTAALRRAVAARRPVDDRERRSIAAFLTAFDTLDAPFDEHASPTHVTASAVVTGDAGVVLHLHKRLSLWLQPGGHIDRGETPWAAALREAREETGLAVAATTDAERLLHVDVHPGPRGHTHLDVRYEMTAPPITPSPPVGESPDVRWFSWSQAIALADPGLEGVLRAAQPGQPVIRPAAGGDAAACARVYTRSKAFGLAEVPEPHTEAEITTWIANEAVPGMDVWVADLAGVVVGQMMLAPGWLYHLYIDPAWMGRGLGDQFMALARQRQPAGFQLWAFQSNARARRFYERHGFRAVEFTDGAGNQEHWPDVRYVQ
jgi:8-oxo-dGTP pyrophosphatase MutT (NUDIX family)/GNAT superfamily N-acetyltransferase